MRRLIFRLFVFVFTFMYYSCFAEDIGKEYEIIKNKIDAKSITSSQNFFFASSHSKATAIEDADIETNKIIASSKFINYLSNLVDWPVTIDLELKIALWNFYTKKKKFTFKKSQIVDNGKLGDYYYVIVGMPKSELLKFKITYSQIINSIKK